MAGEKDEGKTKDPVSAGIRKKTAGILGRLAKKGFLSGAKPPNEDLRADRVPPEKSGR